jgi:hypothetical protein
MQTAILGGKSALKCQAQLRQALSDCTLLYQTVVRWVQTSKSVRVNWWLATQYTFLVCSHRHVSDHNWTVPGWSQMLGCDRISLCVCVCVGTSECCQINIQQYIRLNFLKGIWIMIAPCIFLVLLLTSIQIPISYKRPSLHYYDTFSSWRCFIRPLKVEKYLENSLKHTLTFAMGLISILNQLCKLHKC